MEAKRTLVKSPPELWAEVSDVAALARHLGEFGDIRITRAEPETVVEWEGDRVAGCVRLEPSGWGTRVMLTAHAEPPAAEPPPPAPPPPSPERGWFARLVRRRRQPEPEPPPPEPQAPALDDERAAAVLRAALDALGAAHHRPFSR